MLPIEKNRKEITRLLSSIERPGIEKLILALEKSDFFVSPASTVYHLNEEGGLAQHSLLVYRTLAILNNTFNVGIPYDSVIIVGLLHDLCKANTYTKASGKYIKKKLSSNNHGLKSIKRIKKFIKLTSKEELMIRWHMNHYTWDGDFKKEEDKLKKECPEAYLAYFADHISTLFVEE